MAMNNAESIHVTAAGSIAKPPRRIMTLATTAGRDLLYLLAVLSMSIIEFVVWVTGVSVTLSLLILVVGLLIWLATAYVFRGTASIDRRLATWLRGQPVPGLYRSPESRGILARVRTVTVDPQTWKDFAWSVLNSIGGFVLALFAISVFVLVVGWITAPLWWWAIPDPHHQYGTLNLGIYTVNSIGWAFVTTALGLLLAPLALAINHWLVGRPRRAGRPDSGAVRAPASQRAGAGTGPHPGRRGGRDQRAARANRARPARRRTGAAGGPGDGPRDGRGGADPNPDAARESVRKARDSALSALGELRDLSRGLRPALLQDRGLGTAVEDLTQRAPMPVAVTVTGDIERTPDSVQTAVYFVVAEALTNAAKHSRSGERPGLDRADRRDHRGHRRRRRPAAARTPRARG